MINISQSIIADVDINLAATMLITGVFIMTLRKKSTGSRADTAYFWMVTATLVMSVVGLVLEFIEGPENPGSLPLAVALETVLEMCINAILMLWFLYAFFVMYDSMDYLKRKIRIYMLPVAIMMIMEIINIPTGILWYYDENVVYHDTIFYVALDLVRYAYLIMSIYQYLNYKKENGRMQFFTIWPFLLPFIWGSMTEVFTEFMGFTLGATISVTMLYFMSSQKLSFTDEESGFYNIHYLNMIREKIKQGEYEPHLVIRYSLPKEADKAGFFEQLRMILPDTCDTIKLDDESYITLIYGNTRGLINMLSEDIKMVADSLGMDIRYDYAIKDKQETSLEFFEKNAVIGG